MLLNRIEVIQGDITLQDVDAIVNAANNSLMGGGGVDGAIHRAAGPNLLDECRQLGGCRTGEAKLTRGHNLKAPWIIHTVGPVWRDGKNNEEKLLANCYRKCLQIAGDIEAQSIAFPAISTGAYGFPVDRASKIALQETLNFLKDHSLPEKVIFICFDSATYRVYLNLIPTS